MAPALGANNEGEAGHPSWEPLLGRAVLHQTVCVEGREEWSEQSGVLPSSPNPQPHVLNEYLYATDNICTSAYMDALLGSVWKFT